MKLSTGVRSIFSTLIFIGLVFGMQACGSGGGAPAPLPDQDGSGIYSGTATVDVSTEITDLKGIIYNNRIMVFSILTDVVYDGTITSITSDDYTATVDVYENGAISQTGVTVTGKVITANTISGTIGTSGTAGNHNGTFSLTFDSIYNRGATPERIEAIGFNQWSGIMYDVQDSNTRISTSTTLSFTSTGLDAINCDIIDVYSIPSSTVNIYEFTNMEVVNGASCPYLGTGFSGFSSVVDSAPPTLTDDVLWIVYTNGTHSAFGVVMRL